ncbi:hypothetical protein D3P05_21480 [Paracoccus siganidrum]|uniref:Uncharacterized protein n=1 Tax=Paracoccus siganidrum TaxID=1276757 RepID=A0A418ZUK1_9RHOB|nr:hypothetical protein D3P05_21480 [Paracoccus siganidrum]
MDRNIVFQHGRGAAGGDMSLAPDRTQRPDHLAPIGRSAGAARAWATMVFRCWSMLLGLLRARRPRSSQERGLPEGCRRTRQIPWRRGGRGQAFGPQGIEGRNEA